MLQLFPNGTSLGIFSRRDLKKASRQTALKEAAVRAIAPAEPDRRAMVENLESRELLSTSWFVAPWGSDSNAGSLSAPFKTIQQAANVAGAGDHVEIRAGVYHEDVVVPHSGTASAPIVFEAYNGENVTVSGADPISGWSDYSGSTYDASMSWDLGEGNNQVFVNGHALTEAVWPNTNIADPSHPNTATVQSVRAGSTSAVIYNSSLNQPANYWKGAIIHFAPGQAWVAQTGVVTSSSPGSISVSYANAGKGETLQAGNQFYLFGKFQALDTSGEWYRDPGTGKLYAWMPGNANPANEDVEVKRRLYAFDLSKVHDITIHGVNIFAATINTSGTSRDTVINGITATYVTQHMLNPQAWWMSPNDGIFLDGADSVLENSTIAYSTGDGVVVSGSGSLVTNNVIHDVDFDAADLAGVRLNASGVTVSHNTIYNSGRDGILASVTHATITYNTIHDVGLQTTEPGGIYTVNLNGQGSTMAYNDIYNIHTAGYGGTALFLDNNTSGWNVHNNVTSNVDYGLKMNYVCHNNNIYNNTLGATKLSINSNQQGNWSGTSIYNNIFAKPVVLTGGARVTNNANSAVSGLGAGSFSSGANGVTSVTPPVSTPPVTTPPVTPSKSVNSATDTTQGVAFTAQSGMRGDNFTGMGYADNNDWLSYKLDFGNGVSTFTGDLATIFGGGTIELHIGSPTGALAGSMKVAYTGAWNHYTTQSTAVKGLTGVQTIYLVFKGPMHGVANVNSIKFS